MQPGNTLALIFAGMEIMKSLPLFSPHIQLIRKACIIATSFLSYEYSLAVLREHVCM